MSNAKYSLLIKNASNTQKDLFDNYHCVVLKDGITPFFNYKVKEMVSQTWPGENGEDTYFPPTLSIEAFDWEVKMATKTVGLNTAKSNLSSLIQFLRTSAPFKIYSSYLLDGRQGCHLTEVSNITDYQDTAGNDIIEFAVKFRITDPITSITLS